MKQISKLQEPNSLVEHRASQFADFDNIPYATKDAIRKNLLLEQGHICCYCMKRIPEIGFPYMKVEHFKCQDLFGEMQLTYSNLFGVCTGNEGQPKIKQTCDTRKGNLPLAINPILNDPNCESFFKYNSEGEISSINNNAEIDRQLNEVLNLNMQTLKDGRSEIYLEVQEKVRVAAKKVKNERKAVVKFLEQEKIRWLTRVNDRHKPYCMVAVYYLEKKINQNQD